MMTHVALAFFAGQSVLDPAGPQASRVCFLWYFFVALFAAIWIAVTCALLYSLVRRRTREHSESRTIRTVLAGAAGTGLILLVLVIVSAVSGRDLEPEHPANPLRIKVTARQWWWEFQYQDGPVHQHVTTANELHIPTRRPIQITTTSMDVIHSFWIPNLTGKIDVIPVHANTIAFEASRPGTYRGECSEFCGLQHAHMSFLVVAEPTANWQQWLDGQRQPAHEPTNDAERRGREVLLHSACVVCHSIRGTDAWGKTAPDLTHLASRRYLAAGTLLNTPGNLAAWITDSHRVKPGNHMPPINIASDDIDPLLAYLGRLQ